MLAWHLLTSGVILFEGLGCERKLLLMMCPKDGCPRKPFHYPNLAILVAEARWGLRLKAELLLNGVGFSLVHFHEITHEYLSPLPMFSTTD